MNSKGNRIFIIQNYQLFLIGIIAISGYLLVPCARNHTLSAHFADHNRSQEPVMQPRRAWSIMTTAT